MNVCATKKNIGLNAGSGFVLGDGGAESGEKARNEGGQAGRRGVCAPAIRRNVRAFRQGEKTATGRNAAVGQIVLNSRGMFRIGVTTLCMYSHTYSKSMDEPGKVATPARGQLNRKMNISLSAFVPENFVSRDGFGSPVPRQRARLY